MPQDIADTQIMILLSILFKILVFGFDFFFFLSFLAYCYATFLGFKETILSLQELQNSCD